MLCGNVNFPTTRTIRKTRADSPGWDIAPLQGFEIEYNDIVISSKALKARHIPARVIGPGKYANTISTLSMP